MATKTKKATAKVASKKKRDKEASRLALLEAAIEVFSERGYDAATTREVAKRAGVSEALIQRYFDGKQGLLLEIMEHFSSEDQDQWISHLPFAETLEEEILQVMAANCKQHADGKDFMRVAVSRAIVDPKLGKQVGRKVHEKKIPALRTRLMHYQKIGLIGPDSDLEALAMSISAVSFTLGFMGSQVFDLGGPFIDAMKRKISLLLAKGAR